MNFESTIYTFTKELYQFDYTLSCMDHVWDLIFPDEKNKWHHLIVNNYKGTFYITHLDYDCSSLEVIPQKEIKVVKDFSTSPFDCAQWGLEEFWLSIIENARKWMQTVKKDWIKANKKVAELYPLNRRKGIVSHSLIRSSISDFRNLYQELGKAKTKKFIKLVETRYFWDKKNTIRETLCAKDFFEYCRIAYIASKRKDEHIDESLSGREMYERYADGRHEGLLDIDENSEQEFADWLDGTHPKRDRGGHPWEIKRGGNTTHISLYVRRPDYSKEGYELILRGAAINRIKETISMFLALVEAGLPISISDPEDIRKRLLAQDNIGIFPCYRSLHRANQSYDKYQDVHDVMYFDALGRYKRRLKPFIQWEPLPILKPCNEQHIKTNA